MGGQGGLKLYLFEFINYFIFCFKISADFARFFAGFELTKCEQMKGTLDV